jgi:glycosyltransferase involved in cell wall biosynthesis
MEKSSVLITTSTFPRWKNDTEPNFVYELSKRLTGDFDIIVLCPYANGSKEYEETENMKIYRYKYLPFGMGTLAYDGGIVPKLNKSKLYYLQVPFFLLCQLSAIRSIVKKHGIRTIHAHWLIPQGFLAVLYKKLFNRKIKILTTVHGSDIYGLKSKIAVWIKGFTLRGVDVLTVVSNAVKNEVGKFGYHKEIYTYPMGIDTAHFHPDMKDFHIKEKYEVQGDLLLFVGRLVEKKGVRYLLEAMPAVLKKFPSSKLMIIGDGTLKDELIQMAKDLEIENSVIFTGPVPHADLAAYYATADVFIGPSLSEGFGLVFAEAMSCGTPVVATDLPAISDIVKDNEMGFIVKQRNSSEISDKIIYLLGNRDKLDAMKIKAREYIVQKFDWDIVAARYVYLIRSMQ